MNEEGIFPISQTNAAGHTMELAFDDRFGVLARLVDPNQFVTEWTYDDFGRLALEKRPDGSQTAISRSRTREGGEGEGVWRVMERTTTSGDDNDDDDDDSVGRPVRLFSHGPDPVEEPGTPPRLMQITWSPQARFGLAFGQVLGGIVTLLGGVTGEVLGGAATMSGIGAAIGVPTLVVSTTFVVGGFANITAGLSGMPQAMMSQGSGSGPAKGTVGGKRSGKSFTPGGKRELDAENAAKNNGINKCENCGTDVVPGQRSQRGVSPPGNQRERDHIIPRSQGGHGSPDNGQILCRDCNLNKSDNLP